MDKNTTHITTAVHKGDHYKHFGIAPITASLYGDKPEDIVYVKLDAHEDQERTKQEKGVADYWGWYDAEKQEFTLVYPSWLALYTCFPYGIEVMEERGDGKAYRLKVTEVPDIG